MNKIKVIYDVARKMKDKSKVKGLLTAEGFKGQDKILSVSNTFEKGMQDGRTTGKINIEADCNGKKMKIENSIDFEGNACCTHHGWMKHMHNCHHGKMHEADFKEKWCRLTTMLGLLSSIKIDEKEDGSTLIALESSNIPEELKKGLEDKMKACHEQHKAMLMNNGHAMCMKEFHQLTNIDFILNIAINKNSEVEKITVNVKGDHQDGENGKQPMKLSADLSFEW